MRGVIAELRRPSAGPAARHLECVDTLCVRCYYCLALKLTVRQISRHEVYKDMVRIPEAHRLDRDGSKIGEGKICKITVRGASKLLAVRGSIGADRLEIRMDERTRNDLGVAWGEEYDFEIRKCRWPSQICWSWSASDPAYRIPAWIAVLSLGLGLIGLGLGIASMSGRGRSTTPPLSTRDLFELKVRCAEMGRNYDKELAKGVNSPFQSVGPSRSAYNEKLNTCLYSGQIHSLATNPNASGTTQKFIVDLLTRKELVGFKDDAEFAKREAELLGPKEATAK